MPLFRLRLFFKQQRKGQNSKPPVRAAAVSKPETGEDGKLTITFPQARVLYWETTRRTPDEITLSVIFPDRSQPDFVVPAFKVLSHEIEELEQMRLALLLPFYVLKYRKQVKGARSEEERKVLVPAVEETVKKLLDAVQKLRERELLTEEDENIILGEALFNKCCSFAPLRTTPGFETARDGAKLLSRPIGRQGFGRQKRW